MSDTPRITLRTIRTVLRLGALALALTLAVTNAPWALPGSTFEGSDGDLVPQGGTDWSSFVGTGELSIGIDLPSGQDDDSLRGKEDDPAPDLTTGSIPGNKSDLLRFYVVHETVEAAADDERDLLYVGWVRDNVLGTANMDFEFNQLEGLSENTATPVRTAGDMLITFAFANGANTIELGLSRWTETGPCEASNSGPCWGPIMPLSGIAEGEVNRADVVDPVTGETLPGLTFGEAAIDLTAAGVFDREQCTTFGSAHVKSRSSDSFTASMKDFILPMDVSVSNCGVVTIVENAIPDAPQAFTFTPSPELSPSSFDLDDDGDETNALPSRRSFEGRFDAPVTVAQTPVSGWDLDDVSCTTGGTPGVDGADAPTGDVTIDVGPGESVTCTYVNVQRGRLLVDVISEPAGDPQSFAFHVTGGPDGLAQDFFLADGDGSHDSGAIRPGTYAVAQDLAGPLWDLTTATCDDGSPIDAVAIDPGETVRCTFRNVKRGTIVVRQETLPADDPQIFRFTLAGGPDGVSEGFGLTGTSDPFASTLLRTGTYSVAQALAGASWDLTNATCDDGSPVEAIDLAPGETVTCTFANTKRGTIVVRQDTLPAGDPQLFDFTLTGGPDGIAEAFSLADDTTPFATSAVRPGTYAVAQADDGAWWDPVSGTCDDGSPVAAIDLAPGETVTCTFSNTKRGAIVVLQDTLPASDPQAFDFTLTGGPDALDAAFSLADDSAPYDSGPVRTGTYAVSQGDDGEVWDPTGATCNDGSPIEAVDLAPGETVTCTFSNTKRGKIVVRQDVLPAGDLDTFEFDLTGGPDAVAQSFSLTAISAGGGTHDSGYVRNGVYVLAQLDDGPAWDLSSATCDDGSPIGAIALDPGETVTCSFENVKRGNIVVRQDVLPAGDLEAFAFDVSGGPDAFSASFALTGSDAPWDSGYVRNGAYAVAQTDPGIEWDLSSATCDDGSPIGAIALDPGETVTCSFENVKRGKILIDVATDPSGDPSTFDFELTGGPDAVLQNFSLADADPKHDSGWVRHGAYGTALVGIDALWDATSASCDDGSPVDGIALDPGEIVTCTFVNTKRVRIVLVQQAVPTDPQDFSYDLTGPSLVEAFLLDDDGDGTDDPGANALPDSRTFTAAPGTFDVLRADAGPMWDLTSIACSDTTDGESVGSIDLPSGTVALDAPAGAEWTCVFTDTKRGLINVTKTVADPTPGSVFDPGALDFPFDASWGDPFTLRHGETITSEPLLSGRSYSVSESLGRGWVGSSECIYPDGTVRTGGTSISIDLAPGDEVDCTFLNEMRIHPGSHGFWRNWRNHYTTDEFERIVAEAFATSPVYAGMWEPSGELRSDAIALIDDIYRFGDGTSDTQHLLAELTTLVFNLTASKSEDPAVRALQRNDDVCRDCILETTDPAVDQFLREFAPCELADTLRVGDPIDVAEATWDGGLVRGTWSFGGLDDAGLAMLAPIVGGINHGLGLPVAPDSYPDNPTCRSIDGPDTFTWYLDADLDTHGVLETRIQTCDATVPAGYAGTRGDCDDTVGAVYPGAPEVCDGLANDCNAPTWPAVAAFEIDDDADGFAECAGDCDDALATVYPGAAELCDGIANDCSDPTWPAVVATDRDDDGDSQSECAGDCNDASGLVYFGAPELCDGIANDCASATWPAVDAVEFDADGDGYAICAGDCDDLDVSRHPGAVDVCNGLDDDCSGLADDLDGAHDADGDGVAGACDNCPYLANVRQRDYDGDGFGDLCDNCRKVENADQADLDFDTMGDACDNCVDDANTEQHDADADGMGDVCDPCATIAESSEADRDADGVGDRCDLDDGMIYVTAVDDGIEWQVEVGFDTWNVYRGDLMELKATGVYSQLPGSNPIAAVFHGLLSPELHDGFTPDPGACAYYLPTGVAGIDESGLGHDSTGEERPHDNPCP